MKPGKTVMLIDDDPALLSVLGRAMERRGYEVVACEDSSETDCQLQRVRPDYAVVDLKLSSESGLTLLPELKKHNPDMKILILTGYSSIATTVEAMKLGATNYLCKPADAEQILAALESSEPDPGMELPESPPSVKRLEWEHIQKVLQEHDNNISATARALGMHRRTLQRKLDKRPVRR
ncbi:MAG: response regulator transcription factor [Endozoicomonas sp.]